MGSQRAAFLDSLYTAAISGDGWKSVLQGYARLVGADAAVIQIFEVQSGHTTASDWITYDDGFISQGADWFDRDPWVLKVRDYFDRNPLLLGRPFLFHGARGLPFSEFTKSDYYGGFVGQVEISDCIACSTFHRGELALTLTGHALGKQKRFFTNDQSDAARSVLPDFRRALALHVKAVTSGQTSHVARILRDTAVPAIMVAQGRLIEANATGHAALNSGLILKHVRGRIIPRSAEVTSAIQAVEQGTVGQMASLVHHDEAGFRWLVQVVRVTGTSSPLLQPLLRSDAVAVVFITPLDLLLADRQRMLQGWQAFTNTEREVAAELLNGASPAGIARTRRKSVATIRWHLDNMMARTGTRNLTDLVRILSLRGPL
jgi:DNA-binding CsgD family transcriptional regulator